MTARTELGYFSQETFQRCDNKLQTRALTSPRFDQPPHVSYHVLSAGPSAEADLVFLVDSSASVGAENFYNEIRFIRKLLADFTVSHNTTRVVVITYSSVNQVIRQVSLAPPCLPSPCRLARSVPPLPLVPPAASLAGGPHDAAESTSA